MSDAKILTSTSTGEALGPNKTRNKTCIIRLSKTSIGFCVPTEHLKLLNLEHIGEKHNKTNGNMVVNMVHAPNSLLL
jgi:hypothetical protein